MRARLVFMCICAFSMIPLAACSDTEGEGGSGGFSGDGGTSGNGGVGGAAGNGGIGGVGGEAGNGGIGGVGGEAGNGGHGGGSGGTAGSAGTAGGSGAAPMITGVAWEAAPDCTINVRSNVFIIVTATDADTDAGDLIYNGSVGGCSGAIDAMISTISCPNVAPYPGTVTVSDPDGNNGTPVTFPVPVCESGNCTDNPACSL